MAQLKAAAVSLSLSPLPCFSIVCHRSKRHITKVSPLLFSEQMRSPQRFQDHSFGGEVWVFIFIPSAAHTKTRTQSRGILIERDPRPGTVKEGPYPHCPSLACYWFGARYSLGCGGFWNIHGASMWSLTFTWLCWHLLLCVLGDTQVHHGEVSMQA